MDFNEFYSDIIIEHNSSKKNKKDLKDKNITQKGINASCGDEIEISIRLNNNIIEDIAFSGYGCAISQASTSIMCDIVRGKTKEQAEEFIELFISMIKKEYKNEDDLQKLEDAIAFKNISNMPGRVKCALLSWHTLKEGIK